MKKLRKQKRSRPLSDKQMLGLITAGIASNNRQIAGATMVIVGVCLMASQP